MSFRIVADSCCELPEELYNDPRFVRVPLELEIGDYRIKDDVLYSEFLKLLLDGHYHLRAVEHSNLYSIGAYVAEYCGYLGGYDWNGNGVYLFNAQGVLDGHGAAVRRPFYDASFTAKSKSPGMAFWGIINWSL